MINEMLSCLASLNTAYEINAFIKKLRDLIFELPLRSFPQMSNIGLKFQEKLTFFTEEVFQSMKSTLRYFAVPRKFWRNFSSYSKFL